MDLTTLMQLSAIPATLVVLAGLLVLYRGSPEKAGRRFLFYILGIAVLTGLAAVLGTRYWKTTFNEADLYLGGLLPPMGVGLLALVVLNLGRLRGLPRIQIGLAAVFLLALIWIGAVLWNNQSSYIILGIALALAAVWAGGLRFTWLLRGFVLLALVCLVVFNDPNISWMGANTRLPTLLISVLGVLYFTFPLLVVALAAMLIYRALKPAAPKAVIAAGAEQPEARLTGAPGRRQGWMQGFRLGMAAFLLVGLAYTTYWACIWDQTRDGMSGLFQVMLGAIVGVGAGMLLAIFSAGWRRLVGLAFLAFVPILLVQAFNWGWRAPYQAITESRAAIISSALERYHGRTGVYPYRLSELTPRDLLFIPQPVILQDEPWCYQGTAGAYRLGLVFREYFSSPLSIKVYASAGGPPAAAWACDARLEELKAIYDVHFTEPRPPPELAERLPQSEVPVPRQTLAPVAVGSDLVPGNWSPDGRYFTFSRSSILQILDVTQSLVCSGEEEISLAADPRSATAWLPDGQLLVIRPQGDLALLAPCGAVNPLPGGDTAHFSQVMAADRTSGNVLLKSVDSFWILDGAGRAVKHVEGVTPNPYELHWDSAAWLPGGKRLAISRLNGRESRAGITLYILDGQSGQVQLSLPRANDYDQSAPNVEWLAENELLLNGGGVLAILDLSANPPKETNVMRDLFGLDLAYPNEISAMDSVIDRNGGGYSLAVRANHPRNQSVYLYSSTTRQVQVFKPQNDCLMFFPDGQMAELPRLETAPTYQGRYDLVWVGGPDQPDRQLAAEGHTPRRYPSLSVKPAPGGERLYFGSSQGVSLVTIAKGNMLAFWDLGGGITAYVTGPEAAAANQRFVAVVDWLGLYIIPGFVVKE